jgi:ubiquinone/menaquinone biosynthesis C-methylase UbiE
VAGEAYDRFMGRYSVPLAARFADWLEVSSGQRAIDVGCGPGALTGVLVERLGADSVRAVDPSAPFVDACRERFPGVDVRQGVAEALPFDDDEFDLAGA